MTIKMMKVCTITLAYCLIWMILEKLIYGQITRRTVDDIMILLFVPIIYKAVK